jgi:hypothetical protein
LPEPGEIPGWRPRDKPQHYVGEDLFIFIDGGAEIYHEYGFKQVLAQDYVHRAGQTVACEIFEMADAAAAFGIFTFKSSGKGRPAGVGQDSELEGYYLNFWKGTLLVTVTGHDESPASLDGVVKIAQAADRKIKETSPRPPFASLLPSEWAGPRFKYLKGALGLYNVYPFFPGDVFKSKEAVVGGGDAFRIFVFHYKSRDEAKRRFEEVQTAFAGSSSYPNVRRRAEGTLEAADRKGASLRAEVFEDCIALVLGNLPPPQAQDIIAQLKKQRAAFIF